MEHTWKVTNHHVTTPWSRDDTVLSRLITLSQSSTVSMCLLI